MGSVLHSFNNHYQKSKTFYSRATPGQWFPQVVSSKYGDLTREWITDVKK